TTRTKIKNMLSKMCNVMPKVIHHLREFNMRTIQRLALLIIICLLAPYTVADNAPDSSARGPHEVAAAEYRLPAAVDAEVLSDRMTEVWAKMYFPKDIAKQATKAPLVVM